MGTSCATWTLSSSAPSPSAEVACPDVSLVFRKIGRLPLGGPDYRHPRRRSCMGQEVRRASSQVLPPQPQGAFDSLLKISSPSAPGGYPELDALLLLRVALFKHKGDAFATDCHEIAHPQDYFTRAFQVANMQETLQIDRIVYGNLTTAEYEKKVKTPTRCGRWSYKPVFVPTKVHGASRRATAPRPAQLQGTS